MLLWVLKPIVVKKAIAYRSLVTEYEQLVKLNGWKRLFIDLAEAAKYVVMGIFAQPATDTPCRN